jgi:hypothetical protein
LYQKSDHHFVCQSCNNELDESFSSEYRLKDFIFYYLESEDELDSFSDADKLENFFLDSLVSSHSQLPRSFKPHQLLYDYYHDNYDDYYYHHYNYHHSSSSDSTGSDSFSHPNLRRLELLR